jgi:hypothetical protein
MEHSYESHERASQRSLYVMTKAPRVHEHLSEIPCLAAEEVEMGIRAVEFLRRQRSVQHLPDRAEADGGR